MKIIPADVDLDRVREQLKRDEGTGPQRGGRFLLYKCPAGRWTIGYGRNVEDRGITLATAEQMLDEDILTAYVELTSRFYWFEALSPDRKRALINMHVNLGLSRLLGFQRFLAAAQAGDHDLASVEMLDSKAATVDAPARYLRLADAWRRG